VRKCAVVNRSNNLTASFTPILTSQQAAGKQWLENFRGKRSDTIIVVLVESKLLSDFHFSF